MFLAYRELIASRVKGFTNSVSCIIGAPPLMELNSSCFSCVSCEFQRSVKSAEDPGCLTQVHSFCCNKTSGIREEVSVESYCKLPSGAFLLQQGGTTSVKDVVGRFHPTFFSYEIVVPGLSSMSVVTQENLSWRGKARSHFYLGDYHKNAEPRSETAS